MRGAFRSRRGGGGAKIPTIGDPDNAVTSRLVTLAHVFHLRPRDVWDLRVRDFLVFAHASDEYVKAQRENG